MVVVDGADPSGWWWAERALVEELDQFCFGGGLVGVMGGMEGERWLWWWRGCLLGSKGYDPQTSGRVAVPDEKELSFIEDFAVFLGEDSIASMIAELFN